ncbi:MAG: hypothetical protein ACI38Q_01265 [Candidatus Bruticola sp.]
MCAVSWLTFLFVCICSSKFNSYSCCRANQCNLRGALLLYQHIDENGQYPDSLDVLVPHYFYELPECTEGKYQYQVRQNEHGSFSSYELICTVHGRIE